MKKMLATVAALCMTVQLYVPVSAADEVTIYVSPVGRADASGDKNNPVGSIDDAERLLEKYSGKNVKILFHAGKYDLSDTLTLDSKDSVTFAAYGDGDVIFSGTKTLKNSGFSAVKDPDILDRLTRSARSSVLEYHLSDSGVEYSKNDAVRPYLFVDDVMKTAARYPNGEYLTATAANGTKSFSYDGYDISKWESADDAVLVGSADSTYFWRNYDISVLGNVITASGNVRKGAKFYVENLLEELDTPGEYFIDRDENILYYYPDSEIENEKIEVISFLNDAVKLKSSTNITFDGITFDKIGGRAIQATGAENVVIKNCNFDYVQGDSVISLTGKESCISDNSFYGCANTAVTFHGGSVRTLTNGNIAVKNNRISFCGYKSKNAIISSGSSATSIPSDFGNSVTNNIIQDCMTFMGISINANDYEINYNEIINQGYLIGDGGAIYMGRSNVKYGTEVAYNYIHDGHKNDPAYAYCGLYSDDGYSGTNFHHNVVKDMYQGVIAGIGMNCRINNNLFINNSNASAIGSRMTNYSKDGGAVESGMQDTMYNELDTILKRTDYGELFKTHYPEIAAGVSRKPYFAPWNTEVTGNVAIGGKSIGEKPWHPYYRLDGTKTAIANEETVVSNKNYEIEYGKKYIGQNLYEGYYVDEIALYGASITDANGTDLNCTSAGNPEYEYNADLFCDPENQDYTLKSGFDCAVSDVGSIDMSKISITKSSNPKIYENVPSGITLLTPRENAANVSAAADFSWERVKNASKYRIVISKNADLSNAVADETFNDTSDALVKQYTLENGGSYFWQVTAYGLAKNDSFEIKSDICAFTVQNANYINKANLTKVAEIAGEQIEKYNKGLLEYSDSQMYTKLLQEKSNAENVLNKAASQSAIDSAEDSMISVLKEAKLCMTLKEPKISECRVDQATDNVYVTGSGFSANAYVSVVVTNPKYDINKAANGFDLTSVQYTDTLRADENGILSFVFNTRVDGEDRSGNYTVYMSDERGVVINKTYNYGIISVGALSYKNEAGESVENIMDMAGKKITISCNIENNTSKDIAPQIITAFYKDGKTLAGAFMNSDNVISANSEKGAVWEINVPSDVSEMTRIGVMFIGSMQTMKPLAKFRTIYEVK